MEDYFFLTDKDTRIVHLHVRDRVREDQVLKQQELELAQKRSAMQLDRSSRVFYQKYVYFPREWENLSQKAISKYRRNYNYRFLFWALMNKSTVSEHCHNDARFLTSLQNELVATFGLTFFSAVFVNRFAKRLDPPFIYDFYFNRKYQPKHLRQLAVAGIFIFMIKRQINFLSTDTFLFDTGLKYRHLVAPGELNDPIVDPMRLGPAAKSPAQKQNS